MLLFLDFETYYDDQYSLRKMTPPEYILDARYETIGCAVKEGPTRDAYWVDGPSFDKFVASLDPAKTDTITFNALFDSCILAWRYGFVPRRMLCAMRMAVALHGHTLPSASLATVGKCLGVGIKGTTVESVKGMRRESIVSNVGLWRAYQAYSLNDVDMTAALFDKLIPDFPVPERKIMNLVLRCAVEPRFWVDKNMLAQHLVDIEQAKAQLLIEAGITDPSDLRSSQRFEDILKTYGVDIEYKASLTDPTRQNPCFAKTDEFMANLLEHENPTVQALASARMGVRSTIEATRGQRILNIANLDWSGYNALRHGFTANGYSACNVPLLPIPLRYAGAHTHRLSGDWKYNMQNLPAGRQQGQTNKLRKSLVAPPGCKVVVADKSQIECRINAWICGQDDLLQLFANKGDPYSALASKIFDMPVDKKTMGGIPRFIGKGGELGLGFGCGDTKFYNMVLRQARGLGMDMGELLKIWTPQLATKSVWTYRSTHGPIVVSWRILDGILNTAWLGNGPPQRFGPCTIGNEGGHGYVEGPSKLRMWYGNPRQDEDGELRFDYGKRSFKMYGSKFLENIVQFLARIDTMHDAIRIAERGYPFAMQSHDELAWVVPDDYARNCLEVALEEMRRPPSWAPSLPLDAEGNIGASYGDAK